MSVKKVTNLAFALGNHVLKVKSYSDREVVVSSIRSLVVLARRAWAGAAR